MRSVVVEVGGVTGEGELLDDVAPQVAQAFWDHLPLEATLVHEHWSGRACWFDAGELPASSDFSQQACSIYPGTFLVAPGGRVVLSYGAAELRSELGVEYGTRFARLTRGKPAILDQLSRMHDEGDKRVSVRRA